MTRSIAYVVTRILAGEDLDEYKHVPIASCQNLDAAHAYADQDRGDTQRMIANGTLGGVASLRYEIVAVPYIRKQKE